MLRITEGPSRVALSCSLVAVVLLAVILIRDKRKKKSLGSGSSTKRVETNSKIEFREKNDDLPDNRDLPSSWNWVKVGTVHELYIYPLKSGRGRTLEDCEFTEYGINVREKGLLTLKDRMFIVYNEETGKFQTGRNYPTLLLVSISVINEIKVKLEAVGMPRLIFSVPECMPLYTQAVVQCSMWWGEPVKCIDCGAEAAQWISKFLTGTSNGGLRIGYALDSKRNIMKGPWERFTKVYKTLRNEDAGLFSDLASYMLMTKSSLDELNKRLAEPVPILQFRPNIVVQTEDPFAEDDWEWIKIGEESIIRNVKPCPRCSMVKIDPNTGKVKDEPLKTLQRFREQMEPERVKVDGKAPTFGIYCGLYREGRVKLNDPVFVHLNQSQSELQE
ncbi:mitochondrial amidoxime-reducing component 1-like [Prorops nasuta]|uniref:mitochondrial amidoxime-reducing component 1-like n=1 Tax=Prorops nasuta TaxID=863751 RepID=UPI0034CF5520